MIDKTAYPRFKRTISERELRETYSPSLEEMDWAREMTDTDENRLSLMVWLKCCQRLGRFPRLAEPQVITHVRDELWVCRRTSAWRRWPSGRGATTRSWCGPGWGRSAGALPAGGLRLRLQPGRRPGHPAPAWPYQRP
ncbi:DUF4158 domain-containing protein [Nonomuraea sp. H19]|uniref:DUF4158 domain-containing protein n=1 Tax=Nonomuraea sp. H19 TaxID=3452206 RepID=UPI003F88CE70